MPNLSKAELTAATREAVRETLLGEEGRLLLTRVAEEAAKQALTDFMLKIGMDTTSPQAIIKLQDDMRHLRWWNATVASTPARVFALCGFLATTGAWPYLIHLVVAALTIGK